MKWIIVNTPNEFFNEYTLYSLLGGVVVEFNDIEDAYRKKEELFKKHKIDSIVVAVDDNQKRK